MQMTGEYRIEAPREAVWTALNDPEVLKQCIPGCEELEKTSETEFSAKVKAKVGPVSAKFAGSVTLSDLKPPESYRIDGEGKGGAAGFAKGGATVTLAEDGGATLLGYEVDGKVGGKLAQIGSRLIDGTAKKMADDFFGKFAELVGAPVEAVSAPAEAEAAPEAAPTEAEAAPAEAAAAPVEAAVQAEPAESADPDVGAGAKLGVWVAGTILAVLILLAVFGLG
jgi:carbon monoxide dehydrogenase subunit G